MKARYIVLLFMIGILVYCASTEKNIKRGKIMTNNIEIPKEGLPGLAYFTAKMTLKGAGERSREEIDRFVEFLGGSLNVNVEQDYIEYNIRSLNEYVSDMLELLSDIVIRPTFPEDEFSKLKEKELNRIKLYMSDPEWLSKKAMYKFLFGEGHPYSNYDTTVEAINSMKLGNLFWYHRNYYLPNNSMLIVVGNVVPEEIYQKVKSLFSNWEKGEIRKVKFPKIEKRKEREIILIDRPNTPQATIIVANFGIKRSAKDYIPFRVTNQVFGGGASSRLMLRIRERCGYTYGIYSNITSNLEKGAFYVWTAVKNESVDSALKVLFNEFRKIKEELVPDDELLKSKIYLTGIFPLLMERVENLAELLSIRVVFRLGEDYWDRYIEEVKRVTPKVVKEIAERYFDYENSLVIVVGEAQKLAERLTSFGKVLIYDTEFKKIKELEFNRSSSKDELPECAKIEIKRELRRDIPGGELSYPEVHFPKVRSYTLENGLKLYIISDKRLPISIIKFVVKGGSSTDPI